MAYQNYMEIIVLEELNNVLDKMKNMCKCEKCRQDIAAWTLNRLKPKYVVTDLGMVYTKFDGLKTQTRTDVVVQLINAAKIIKKKPRH